ncbi:hypothetical protein C3747_51g175 [Trypanosoma cruzi]|uniref:Ribosomal protein L30 ferredoxin-like fold domain-containing protein n=1 Tax=Trypanosoma cruzi TaxID=5693 RepID=A0A2V2WX58_TRYCR|nr:hypothetical protein C3747_51g175 [Trypanosoma cruzi]
MRRAWISMRLPQWRCMCHGKTALLSKPSSTSASGDVSGGSGGGGQAKSSSTSTSNSSVGGSAVAATSIAPGPYRVVGNIFIVHCNDHPFKHSWEINRMLRELRLEFKGQTTIVPDIPQVRKQLWRVRHVVRIDMLDLDEAKALIWRAGAHQFWRSCFTNPGVFGRVRAVANPVLRSKMNFMKLRRMRLRDVLHRDALELRILEERRKALEAAQRNEEQQSSPPMGQTLKEEASHSS